MKIKKVVNTLLISILVVSIATATGCSKENSAGKSRKASTTSKLDADQTLNLLLDEPLTLDPNDARNSGEFQILTQVQEGLARVFTDKNGNEKLEPAGAKSWDISKDGLTWTFHLRDYKWSDGKKVTAQNYVDSIIRLLDPKKAFSYAFFAYDIKNAKAYYAKKVKASQVGVKALDDKTLQITLAKPAPQFEKKIAFAALFPIRLDVIKAGGETWATDYKKHVYSGPFIIKEWTKNSSIVLKKNPDYWDAKSVKLKTVNLTVVNEIATQAQMFESQQLDVVQGQQDYTAKWIDEAKKGKFQYIKKASPSTDFIGFNQKTNGTSGIMGNAKIRKALSLAIDREDLVNTIYNKNYSAYGIIPKGIDLDKDEFRSKYEEALKKDYEAVKDDNEKLQTLFKEGLEELGKSEDLSKIKLVFISTESSSLDKSIQEYWKQTWEKKLGIKIELKSFGDFKAYAALRNSGKYDILLGGWFGDYNDPMTFMDLWITNSGFSKFFGGYHSKQYDSIFKKLDGEQNIEKRGQVYSELETQLVAKDAGIAPYMYLDSRYFVQNYVKNISLPSFGPSIEFSRAYIQGK
ncbi:peptide ABC transporter substrate-binding protein [Clostridium oryzae]|uniref:Oligopeptide-binding protein OppA n=1 Tax=Clostridium oryzae TaxID=1450648 RepID=A0A1V4ICY7_9CLOT|nr:peptide ABC transporter substrate-binding protein [Clostridium oryzae]OPJ57868.1 oligopeptide-binding protein OppA precursor [Clostridium oryzae]